MLSIKEIRVDLSDPCYLCSEQQCRRRCLESEKYSFLNSATNFKLSGSVLLRSPSTGGI